MGIFNSFIAKIIKSLQIKKFLIGIAITAVFAIVFLLVYFLILVPKAERENLSNLDAATYKSTNENVEQELSIKQDDLVIGDVNAPVTIISYDSFSCGHCAFFYLNTFNIIKQNYIDTKIAKFVHRDFPTDKASIDVSRLNNCYKQFVAKNEYIKQFSLIISLYTFQSNWLKTDYLDNVKKYFRIAGMSDDQINECLKIDDSSQNNADVSLSNNNSYIEDYVNNLRRISSVLGIIATPTIFVNNVKNDDKNSPEIISKMIEDAYNNYKISLDSDVTLDEGTGDNENQENVLQQENI